MSKVQKQFGKRLREIRLSKGISQEDLAGLAGLHRTYVSSIERGERNISLVNIERLAKALGIKTKEFFP
jgi:transcriptional regulator with XRE-family HTH domain